MPESELKDFMNDLVITGFDSAWGGTQKGAICDLRVDKVTHAVVMETAPVSVTWDEAVKRIDVYSDTQHHIIAIDQGLVVPNTSGMRPVEKQLAKALGSMHCSAYPSNRSNQSSYGEGAGIWRFLAGLQKTGYRQDPMSIPQSMTGRFFFECYPHPAIIGLLGRTAILKYKCRHRNSDDWNELLDYLDLLPIVNLAAHLNNLRQHTKANEDMIDAIVCAYVGYLWWSAGTSWSSMIGNLATGYMITPHTPVMLDRFKSVFKRDLNNRSDAGDIVSSRELSSPSISASVLPPSVQSQDQPPESDINHEWSAPVELVATDTTNLSRTMRQNGRSIIVNNWLDRFSGHRLWLKFLDEDGEPEVAFVPHSHSQQQMTLKPDRDAQPGLWYLLVAGTSKVRPLLFRVQYRFQPLH